MTAFISVRGSPALHVLFAVLVLFAGLPFAAGQAMAQQTFPSRVVTLVVPSAAGGPMDIFARKLAQEHGQRWNEPAVVENKHSAGAALGTQSVVRSRPDGYTLLVANDSIASHGLLYQAPLFAPAGMPDAVLSKLRTDLVGALRAPAFEAAVRGAGYVPRTSSGGELEGLIADVQREAREAMRSQGIQAE